MNLTSAEWQLMNALWQGHPAIAREIADRLPPETTWAYTTIKTMLTRLVQKNAISEHKRGNLSFYEPILTKRRARTAALHSLADDAFEGAFGPLMHFLVEEEPLSEPEKRKLKRMLREKPGKEKRRDRNPQ